MISFFEIFRIRWFVLILTSYLLFFCSNDSNSLTNSKPEYGIIEGRVVDDITKDPIANVMISILPMNDSLYTDDAGIFGFSNLEFGQYILIASKINYVTDTLELSIDSSGTKNVIFNLDKIISEKDRYSFYVREVHDVQEVMQPRKIIVISSEKVYGNIYPLIGSITLTSNKIDVVIDSVDFSGGVLPSPSKASMSFELNIDSGNYLLSLNHKSYQDMYNLTISDSSISVENIQSFFSIPEHSIFWRFPENSFYYTCGTTIETSWICCAFLDTLNKYISLDEFNAPDSGEFCYPTYTLGHYYEMDPKYFYYQSEADFELAGSLFIEFSQNVANNYSGVGLVMRNWTNKSFRSWLY